MKMTGKSWVPALCPFHHLQISHALGPSRFPSRTRQTSVALQQHCRTTPIPVQVAEVVRKVPHCQKRQQPRFGSSWPGRWARWATVVDQFLSKKWAHHGSSWYTYSNIRPAALWSFMMLMKTAASLLHALGRFQPGHGATDWTQYHAYTMHIPILSDFSHWISKGESIDQAESSGHVWRFGLHCSPGFVCGRCTSA
jgi:hypothetical protein